MVLIAILAYLLATGLLLRSASRARLEANHGWRWLAGAAALLHLGYHAQVAWRTPGGPDLHFYSALSLVGLGMAAMTVLMGSRGRNATVGVVVFPLAAVLLALPPAWMWSTIAGAAVMSVVVGLVFGLLPAWRAAQLDPIEALRS